MHGSSIRDTSQYQPIALGKVLATTMLLHCNNTCKSVVVAIARSPPASGCAIILLFEHSQVMKSHLRLVIIFKAAVLQVGPDCILRN